MNLVSMIFVAAFYMAFFVLSVRWWIAHRKSRISRLLLSSKLEMSGRTIARVLGGGTLYFTVYWMLDWLIADGLVESRIFSISPGGFPRNAYWAAGRVPEKAGIVE